MAIRRRLEQAIGQTCAAAAAEGNWRTELGRLAAAVDAEGAVIVSEQTGRPTRVISSPSLEETVATYLSGATPPDPRQARVQLGLRDGFAVDLDHFSPDEIKRDPFYQEFLRPHSAGWHACACLARNPNARTYISFKRSMERAPFDPVEIDALNSSLPRLRAAFEVSQALREAKTLGAAEILARTCGIVFQVAANGQIVGHTGRNQGIAGTAIGMVKDRLSPPSRRNGGCWRVPWTRFCTEGSNRRP